MPVATFDTLKFANTLKEAGVPPAQAEAQARAFAEVIQLNFKDLVTKDDLQQAVKDVRQDVKEESVKQTAKSDVLAAKVDAVYAKVAGEMLLLKWMFGATFTGVVGILIRLFVYCGGF